ncbi:M48 family metallopeptidase [Brevundimonas sp. 2R-24]|uniref:M48 family metallopeptidase n=1 Tax=Peiella sedimenti TaxID=3061083 RepID=A0ABT8SQL3_9CAUL|nr:M48 family metallopeptidase [Caulobacteraceae bacterium XZ-24]
MKPVARLVTAAALAAGLMTSACAYNEALGRNQVLIVDDSALIQASNQAWAQAMNTQTVVRDAALNARLQRVGQRIVTAAGLTDRQWQYAVFREEQPNAFVLPGGQIGVTTGLLSLAANDDQLAAVIGHEVGHVVARHTAERYSRTALTQTAIGVAQGAAGSRGQTVGQLGSVLGQYGLLLPHSRQQELEADRLGIDYMARAGYDARQAVILWQAMASRGGAAAPEFMSTHPSDSTRIANIQRILQERGLA